MSGYAYCMSHWRDVLEIAFFSYVLYVFACWLKHDKRTNLIGYFYTYCVIILMSHSLELPTLNYVLFITAPIVIILFIFMHHDVLQRNFIAIKNITVEQQSPRDWLNIVLRGALTLLNANVPALIIIEHTDSLAPFLTAPSLIDAPITHGMMELICEMRLLKPDHVAWITSTGTIQAINASWKKKWHTHHGHMAWTDTAIAHTLNTDAIVVYLDPATHSCTVVLKGILHEHISLEHVASIIQHHINYPFPIISSSQGLYHDAIAQKNRVSQHTS